jgi:beta-lactamase superfamily II metal-dependent hydrolase
MATRKRAPRTQSTVNSMRVRMFRVGFGDFFLVSLPGVDGAKHILIDCGVHAGDLHSIQAAVAQLTSDTSSHLSLVVMTHRHADHISGFATCRNAFANFTVDQVWMPWFEDPTNAEAHAFQASLTAVAAQLQLQLAARGDSRTPFALMAANATGVGSSNQQGLDVLHGGFKNKAPVRYYKSGDPPDLPPDLVKAGLTARILGPPMDKTLISQMTNVNQQYLTADAAPGARPPQPFARTFRANPNRYPSEAFRLFRRKKLERLIGDVQPDALAARAAHVDNTLNNQSLVILFTFRGKNLLFAGDAQWGNWENFLYGGAYGTPGHTAVTAEANAVLGKLDFYKVGHHGSANATPKDAVKFMRNGLVAMCSTAERCYHNVPKGPLLDALKQKTNSQIARSDQVSAGATPPESNAGSVPHAFSSPGSLYIDYIL